MLNAPKTILIQLLPTNRVNSTKPHQKSKCPTGTDSPGEHRDTSATTSIAHTAPEGWEEQLELGPCTHTAPRKEVSPPTLGHSGAAPLLFTSKTRTSPSTICEETPLLKRG